MTTCQFNNLSSLCAATFSEGGGGDNCTHAMISVLVQKTQINSISIVQNQGVIGAKYLILWARQIEFKLEEVQVFSFADHSE